MKILCSTLLLVCQLAIAQVGIGTVSPDPSAALEISSTNGGILVPRMDQTQRSSITSPALGLLVYQTDGSAGFWYYSSSGWTPLNTSAAAGWGLTGNSGTNATTDFVGTTDDADLIFKRNNTLAGQIGSSYLAMGVNALASITTGTGNLAYGNSALQNTTDGYNNTALGILALRNNTSGYNNVAVGRTALVANNTGNDNTAVGSSALFNNSSGSQNTAFGRSALQNNTTASTNTAIGYRALYFNSTGGANTAVGHSALNLNSTGALNVAIGYEALDNNTSGSVNVAVGGDALNANTGGNFNVSVGVNSMFNNTDGDENTGLGQTALYNTTTGSQNTGVGLFAGGGITTGSNNVAIGSNSGTLVTSGSNNVIVGNFAQPPSGTASNQVRMGNTSITYAGVQVAWSITSDARWKSAVRTLPYGLDLLMALKPVDYLRIDSEEKGREMGFIAQEVDKVLRQFDYTNQGFLTITEDGYHELRYNDFIALLVKGVQDQQQLIDSQQEQLDALNIRLARLEEILLQADN